MLTSWVMSQWGWCVFKYILIQLNLESPKIWFVFLVNDAFILVVGPSSVLLFPDMEMKEFSCHIRVLLKGDTAWSAFHGWKPCAWNQCSESKRQHIGWSPTTCRTIHEGKKASVAFLSIDHLGQCLFTDLNTHCNQVASNRLLVTSVWRLFCPSCMN